MIAHKNDSMTILLVLLVSSVFVSAGSSEGTGSPDYDADKEDSDFTDDFEVCFEKMKEKCKKDEPSAFDCAKRAMHKWKKDDMLEGDLLRNYYETFNGYLSYDHFLSPVEWCFKHVEIEVKEETPLAKAFIGWFESMLMLKLKKKSEDGFKPDEEETSSEKDEMTRCLSQLFIFGDTKKDGVYYAFYNTKLIEDGHSVNDEDIVLSFNDQNIDDSSNDEIIGYSSDDNEISNSSKKKNIGCNSEDKDIGCNSKKEDIDYKYMFMEYMINNLLLKGGMKSPRQFCMDYHNKLAEERNKKKVFLENQQKSSL